MTPPSLPTPTGPPAAFAPTRWTLVLRARGETPEAQAALSELCEAYWTPIFRFLLREGRTEDAARDLTQEFFARLLAGRGIERVERGRGRFRSFLLGALKHFLTDQRDRDCAAKRGGGQPPNSLDAPPDSSHPLSLEPSEAPPPGAFFDRQWALALPGSALGALEAEFKPGGKPEHFAVLKPWLVGETDALPQAEAAARLGLTEWAVKVAVHRLRKRFRELIKAEVGQTIGDPTQADEELRYIIEVLSAA